MFALPQQRRISLGQWSALTAFTTSLIYSLLKVRMAILGEFGLPGFPPPADANTSDPDIAKNEWILVGLGLCAALLALITLWPQIRRLPHWLLAAAVLVCGGSQAAGAVGMTLRITRILPDLGPGPQGPTTWIVLMILDIGAIAWLTLAWRLFRHGHIANEMA